MRTAYRLVSTAVAVGAIFPFGTTAAYAETTAVKVETSTWFWSAQQSGEVAQGYALPPLPQDPSGVPAGDLAVAYKGETKDNGDGTKTSVPDKETYLAWDVYSVPEGSYVDSFTFTLYLDTDAKQVVIPVVDASAAGQGTKAGQPPIVACLPSIGFGQGDAEAFELKPEDNCADQVYGSWDEATKSYTFDATLAAQDWVDGKDNFGLAIRPPEDQVEPFQLVFEGKDSVKATLSYTPPAPEPTDEPTFVAPIPLPPAPDTGTSGYVPDVQVVQPQPQPQPQPTPVALAPRPVPVQNVAASPLRASRALSPVFWFAMIGGVLLIGTMSLILGDPIEPAGSRNRVRPAGAHRLAPATVPGRATRPVRPRTV